MCVGAATKMCLVKIVHFFWFFFAFVVSFESSAIFFPERASVAYRVLVVPLRGAVA
jgi:hypothetical protein